MIGTSMASAVRLQNSTRSSIVIIPKSPMPYLLSESALPPVMTISNPCIAASLAVATSPQLMHRFGSDRSSSPRNRAPGPALLDACAAAPATPPASV